MAKEETAGAIITSAGTSQRMGEIDKTFAILCGKPVLAWSVETLQKSTSIDRIVIVLHRENVKKGKQLVFERGWTKVADVCPGGRLRQDSVAIGLGQLSRCRWVAIHDGARPLVTENLIKQGLEAAQETGAAIAAVPVTDTIKMAGDDLIVRETPPRDKLWAVQTPQIFRFNLITEAHHQIKTVVTDDASMVEQLGHKVKLYMGSYDNVKITTPDDLALAEMLCQGHNR